MVQYYFDFSSYENDSDLFNEWTPDFNADTGDFALTTGTGTWGDHYVEHTESSSSGHRFVKNDAIGTANDVEVVGRYRKDTYDGSESTTYYWARTASDAIEGYTARYSLNDVQIVRYGNTSILAETFKDEIDPTSYFWMRFRVNGTDLMAKAWQDGTAEPSSWDATVTDSELSSGGTGFGHFEAEPGYWDVVGIGTGGDSAPTSPLPPAAPANLNATEI